MGRPIRYDADYFSHSVHLRDDLKIKALRKKLGLKGYATYLMVLETLAGSALIQIELTEIEYEMMAGDFDIEVSELKGVIDYSIYLKLLFENNNILRSEDLDASLDPLFSHRKMSLKELRGLDEKRREQFTTQKLLETTHSIGEDSSEEVSKEKKRGEKKRGGEYRLGEEIRGGDSTFTDFLDAFKRLRSSDEPPVDIHEAAELDGLFGHNGADTMFDAIKQMQDQGVFTIHALKLILEETSYDW